MNIKLGVIKILRNKEERNEKLIKLGKHYYVKNLSDLAEIFIDVYIYFLSYAFKRKKLKKKYFEYF